MGLERINYSCGHEGELQMYGPHKDRDRKKAWLESEGLCPSCYQAKKATERQAANAAASTASEAAGMPALIGTDKQIAWATTIRQSAYDALCQMGKPHPEDGYSRIANVLSLIPDAKWWIDHRQISALDIVRQINVAYPDQVAAIREGRYHEMAG